MFFQEGLAAHLATGLTTVCRCWAITRSDGEILGFTDHDQDLSFEGVLFRADTGLTAGVLQQTTGLAVDNAEAVGALTDAAIREEDINAGRFDGAEVRAWLVNWVRVDQRTLQFKGSIGEVRRAGGAFHAELRGLAEALNQPGGRVFQAPCDAILGDRNCGVNLEGAGYSAEIPCESVDDGRSFFFSHLSDFDDRWFERGRLVVLSGEAKKLSGTIKNDRLSDSGRRIELWQRIRARVANGDLIRLEVGCDKRPETCRLKFSNIVNFRGFPSVPGEDWMMAVPAREAVKDGGKRTV